MGLFQDRQSWGGLRGPLFFLENYFLHGIFGVHVYVGDHNPISTSLSSPCGAMTSFGPNFGQFLGQSFVTKGYHKKGHSFCNNDRVTLKIGEHTFLDVLIPIL